MPAFQHKQMQVVYVVAWQSVAPCGESDCAWYYDADHAAARHAELPAELAARDACWQGTILPPFQAIVTAWGPDTDATERLTWMEVWSGVFQELPEAVWNGEPIIEPLQC